MPGHGFKSGGTQGAQGSQGTQGSQGAQGAVGTPLTTASAFMTSDTALGSGATNLTSLSLATGTWLIHGFALLNDTSATNAGICDIWLGPNSASSTGAYIAGRLQLQATTGTVNYGQLFVATVQVLGSTTTVFLEGVCNNASTVTAKAQGGIAANIYTGIWALKIA